MYTQPSMTDFTIKAKISMKDFLLLSLVVSFSHNFIKVTTIVGLIATIFSIFQILIQNVISPLLILGVVLLLIPILVLYKTSVLYDKSNELSKEFTLHFNDSHFKVIGQESIDSIAWNRVIKVKNTKNCLIIFTGIHTAKAINKKYLSVEQKKFIMQKGT
jgi:hypothetical protein